MNNPHRNHRPWPTRYLLLVAALGVGMPIVATGAFTASTAAAHSVAPIRLAAVLAQDTDTGEDAGVSSDQVEKYVAVYRDMQRDRSLTVENAAAKERLSISEFRQLEQKIARDGAALERVRSELQAAAAQSPSPAFTAAPSKN